jgi:hypothetical protein
MTLRQWFNENQQVRAFYSTRSQITLHCSADDTECGRNFIIFEFFLSKAPGPVRLSLRSTELSPVCKCCISSSFLRRSTSITASFSVNVDWMASMLRGSSTSKTERRIRGWREDALKISQRCCGSDFGIPGTDRLAYSGWHRNFFG